MKKIGLVVGLLVLASALFAGGDKIGVQLGSPLGLSYSHEFNKTVQLDLLASFNGFSSAYLGGINAYLGALFTVGRGSVNGNPWMFTIGPSLGGTIAFWDSLVGSLDILADFRWEVDIPSVPGFNIFLDAAPGVAVCFGWEKPVFVAYRAGLGLRYRIK